MQQENTEKTLEKIIGKKTENGVVEYKILWKNTSESEATWETGDNLAKYEKEIQEYEEQNKPKIRGRPKKNNNEIKIHLDINSQRQQKMMKKYKHKKYKKQSDEQENNSNDISLMEEDENNNKILDNVTVDDEGLGNMIGVPFKVTKIYGIYKRGNFVRFIVKKRYENGKKAQGYIDSKDTNKITHRQFQDFIHSIISFC